MRSQAGGGERGGGGRSGASGPPQGATGVGAGAEDGRGWAACLLLAGVLRCIARCVWIPVWWSECLRCNTCLPDGRLANIANTFATAGVDWWGWKDYGVWQGCAHMLTCKLLAGMLTMAGQGRAVRLE